MIKRNYYILRNFAPHHNKEPEVIKQNLTLAEAQEHCNDPTTREEGEWLDCYTDSATRSRTLRRQPSLLHRALALYVTVRKEERSMANGNH